MAVADVIKNNRVMLSTECLCRYLPISAATCIKGLMPLTEGSPTVQLQPIAADDTLPSEPSEPSSLIVKLLFLESLRCEALSAADCFSVDEWAFNELPLLPINCSCKQSCFEQATAVNI